MIFIVRLPNALLPKKIESMLGYIPGEQMPGVRVVKLNTNENPYPPSPTVTAMLRNIDSECLRRYPGLLRYVVGAVDEQLT